MDDYIIRLPDENFNYYHIIFLVDGSFYVNKKEFYLQVVDDKVIISDVNEYPYLMTFFEKFDLYINE